MKRLAILGIDGLDNDLLKRWAKDLPHLSKLRKTTPKFEFQSIFPPDTTPAWASIYTGMSPAEHGVINFVNPADKDEGYEPFKLNDSYLQGKTFWDAVSDAGHSVCVVLPMLVSFAWKVKGCILARSTSPNSTKEPLSAFPEDIIKHYSIDRKKLNLVGGFTPHFKLAELSKILKNRLDEEARIAEKMLINEQWELFFSYFSALDEVQHVFWHLCDPEHPHYPGSNDFENTILDFYKHMDTIIGSLIQKCNQDDAVMVLSDHGHGCRPWLVCNINEWLRRSGYLVSKAKSNSNYRKWIKANMKKMILGFVSRFGAGGIAMGLSKRFPVWKRLLASSSSIDWRLTRAYVSDLSAVKNYSYGGIRINRNANSDNVDDLVDKIIQSLGDLTIPGTNDKLVKWIGRREEQYNGMNIEKYPEILLEIDERYGIGWDHTGDLFKDEKGICQLKPGTHRRSTAVLLGRNLESDLLAGKIDLLAISPLVKEFFGIRIS